MLSESRRPNDLSQFMTALIPRQSTNGTFFQSRTADRIHAITGHESLTEPIVATLFWDIISYTSFFRSYASQYRGRSMVVHHGINEYSRRQYSLLVLVPELPHNASQLLHINEIPRNEIDNAFIEWIVTNRSE